MRKALIVGIDYYENISQLHGCVNDAYSVKTVFERHSDGTKNFGVLLETSTGPSSYIERKSLKEKVERLFEDKTEIALFYFSGHGYIEKTGGYLITSECKDGDDGLAINDLLQIANSSPARSKIIILDCCHSGVAGNLTFKEDTALLSEGLTILTASSATQYAMEDSGSGVFTSLLVDALNGGASNLVGEITPGSIYAHIDQSLGPWEQRPIFKTNVTSFTSLRKVQPPIELQDLKLITTLFQNRGEEFNLDPTYEPERSKSDSIDIPAPIEENVEVFKVLQMYNRINLVVPMGAPHMWHAAMQSKSCKLTVLGEHYWSLVKKGRI